MITDTLRRIGNGAFINALDTASSECVRQVSAQGGTATLTVKLTFKVASRGGAIKTSGEFSAKHPKAAPLDALLWATDDGDLLPNDPRQSTLPLQVVAINPTEAFIKSVVDESTGEIRQVG